MQARKEPGTSLKPDTGAFTNITHTEWTRRDGAPGSVSSLAQTADGYLWIGSAFGLYRFDGVRFAAYPFASDQAKLPTQYVVSIAADPFGGLWIGLRMTSVVHLRSDGLTEVYGRGSGLTSDTLDHVVVRKDGSVWVLAGGKLMTLENEKWVDFGSRHGLGHGSAFSIFFDHDDTMWIAQDHRLVSLRQGQTNFEAVPTSVFIVSSIAQTREGKLWLADAWRTVKPLGESTNQAAVRLQGRAELLVDSRDNLWIAEDYFGLARVIEGPSPQQPRIEHAASQPWITSPHIGGLIEDREGNIWVGTALGLDRYQRTPFQHFRAAPLNFYPSVVAANDGSVWINSHGEPLMRWDRGNVTKYGKFVTYGPLATRRNGDVCFVDARANELQCYGSAKATFTVLDKRLEYAPALALMEDRDGSLLASFEGKGLWRYNRSWEKIAIPDFQAVAPLSMLLDSVGRLWLGGQGDQIAYRNENGFHLLSLAEWRWTSTLAFHEGAGVIWAAGADGLAFFDGRRMHRVLGVGDGNFAGTSGIAFDNQQNLWLNSGEGAIRINSRDVASLILNPQYRVNADIFNDRDGITGRPTQFKPTPSLIADKSGTLWFATAGDLVRVNPQNFIAANETSNVLIESVIVDGRELPATLINEHSDKAASESSHSIEFNFIGLNLSQPERMNYRYRLDGEDKTWIDAGTRRQAFYTRLGPGNYVFHVSARVGQGDWIDLKSPFQIQLRPAVYQTSWFYSIMAVAMALLLVATYLLRLRYVAGRIRLLAEERADERVKIARDLHDTLLQGIQGVMLQFHYTAQMVTDDLQRKRLDSALGAADEVLAEGRDRLEDLRATDQPEGDLAARLVLHGTSLNWAGKIAFAVHTEGPCRLLNPEVTEEVFCIAREALNNAFAHSNGKAISISIFFGRRKFAVHCLDDGCGIDSAVLQGGVKGHWGLQGMRERANQLGGSMDVQSRPGSGTTVLITIPARRAYKRNNYWAKGPT